MRRTGRLFIALVLGCATVLASAPSAQVRRWPSSKPPAPWPASRTALPPFEIRTIGNGLRVVVVAQHEQPVVSAQLLVMAGAALDPPGKGGLANLVAALLDQGTTSLRVSGIAEAVEAAGAELTVLSGMDATFVQMNVLAERLSGGLEILSSVTRSPSFPREELERQRQQLRAALRANYADPAYIADAAFARLVYGRHPYGRPADGTPDSTSRITRDDLVAFHRRHYVPNRSELAIVGDVDVSRAFADAERAFGTWESRAVADMSPEALPAPAPRMVIVDVPGAQQTEVRMGGLTVSRLHPDAESLDLAVRLLAGEGANPVLKSIRDGGGVTATFDGYRDAGVVRAGTRLPRASETSASVTVEAVRLLSDEWRRLGIGKGVTDRTLDPIGRRTAAGDPMGLETPGSISTRVLTALLYGRPLESLATSADRLLALTPDDVTRVARQHLPVEALTTVVVGNAAALAPRLKRLVDDATVFAVVPLSALSLDADDLQRSSAPPPATLALPPEATPADRVRARSVVSLAAKAAGGVDRIRDLAGLRADGQTVMLTPDGPLTATSSTTFQYPDRMLMRLDVSGQVLVQVFDAGHAWLSDAHGPRDASEPMRRDLEAVVARDWLVLFKAVLADQMAGRRLPDETGRSGESLLAAEFWSPRLPPVRLVVDASTGRLVRVSYQVAGPVGLEVVDDVFSDFRLVGGLQVPHRIVTRRDGVAVHERTLSAVVADPALAAGLFSKPK